MLADYALPRPKSLCHRLIHDYHRRGVEAVSAVEKSALQQACAHRFKEAIAHALVVRDDLAEAGTILCIALDKSSVVIFPAIRRQARNQSRRHHAGCVSELFVSLNPELTKVVRIGERFA